MQLAHLSFRGALSWLWSNDPHFVFGSSVSPQCFCNIASSWACTRGYLRCSFPYIAQVKRVGLSGCNWAVLEDCACDGAHSLLW